MGWSPSFDVTKRWQTFFIAGERANQEFDGSLPVILIKNLNFVVFYLNISITQIQMLEKAP
jgi:hypothetical protein